jgi:UDP-glucuronate 4-epimerase
MPMQAGDVARTEADVEETKAALDYQPKTPIEVGVGNFVDWFLTYYKNV